MSRRIDHAGGSCGLDVRIILLGKFPPSGRFAPTPSLWPPTANGISVGSAVMLQGVYAGQVTSVNLIQDDGKYTALIVLQIDHSFNIPASAAAILGIKPQAVGNPYVDLTVSDAAGPMLPQDSSARLNALPADASLIPQKVFDDVHNASQQLSTVATDLHVLLVYSPPEAIAKADPNDPNRPRENISTVVVRLNGMVKSLQDLLTDPALQGKVRGDSEHRRCVDAVEDDVTEN